MTDYDAHDYISQAQHCLEAARSKLAKISEQITRERFNIDAYQDYVAASIRLGDAWAELARLRIHAGPPLHTFGEGTSAGEATP